MVGSFGTCDTRQSRIYTSRCSLIENGSIRTHETVMRDGVESIDNARMTYVIQLTIIFLISIVTIGTIGTSKSDIKIGTNGIRTGRKTENAGRVTLILAEKEEEERNEINFKTSSFSSSSSMRQSKNKLTDAIGALKLVRSKPTAQPTHRANKSASFMMLNSLETTIINSLIHLTLTQTKNDLFWSISSHIYTHFTFFHTHKKDENNGPCSPATPVSILFGLFCVHHLDILVSKGGLFHPFLTRSNILAHLRTHTHTHTEHSLKDYSVRSNRQGLCVDSKKQKRELYRWCSKWNEHCTCSWMHVCDSEEEEEEGVERECKCVDVFFNHHPTKKSKVVNVDCLCDLCFAGVHVQEISKKKRRPISWLQSCQYCMKWNWNSNI